VVDPYPIYSVGDRDNLVEDEMIILSALILFLSSSLFAVPIDDATLIAVMEIADAESVPRSVAYQLQVEESGDRHTGTRGDAGAINNDEPEGWPSKGLYQLYMKPENINYLLALYWYGRGETETFDPLNPIHSAKVGLRYLADLHRQLGTWYRAACAYNAGKSRVLSGVVEREARYARTRAYARRIVNAPELIIPQPPSFDYLPEAFRASALAEWGMGK
jgi:hypothetical protein